MDVKALWRERGSGPRASGSPGRACLAALAVIVFGALTVASAAAFNLKKADPSVVRIYSKSPSGRGGITGSGFVITDGGHVVTNFHVVARHLNAGYGLAVVDGNRLKPARVVWRSPGYDLAIIQAKGLRRPRAPLALEEPEKGDPVYAIGFPGVGDRLTFARDTTFTEGVVGRKFRAPWRKGLPEIRIIQHSADINKGNSGGPLFNDCGGVVGINTQGSPSFLGRDDQGRIRAVMPASGVQFASSIRVLIPQIQRLGLNIETLSGTCVIAAETPWGTYWGMVALALLAVTAIVLSLRRPRVIIKEVSRRVSDGASQIIARRSRRVASTALGTEPVGARPPSHAAADWVLDGCDGDGRAVHLALGGAALHDADKGLTVGRGRSLCDVTLDDKSVSRRHARFVASGAGLTIEDLNASNGTVVNGRHLDPYEAIAIDVGAEIVLGNITLTLSKGG